MLCFALRRGDLARKPIWCSKFTPYLVLLIEKWGKGKYYRGKLSDWLWINPTTDISFLQENDIVSFFPMEVVKENAAGAEFRQVAFSEVAQGYTRFAEDDLIWAKITPCMQNGKSTVTRGLNLGVGFGSTEFHVLRSKNDAVNIDFIKNLLNLDVLLTAAQASFSGTAGQQRVPDQFLADLPLLLPPISIQKTLVSEIEAARKTKQAKLAEVEELIDINEFVLGELGLLIDQENHSKTFAVRFGSLTNRFDVDYYTPRFRKLREQIKHTKHNLLTVENVLSQPLISGFAAGPSDQTDDAQFGIPHIRPFNITPTGEFSLEKIKYVPAEIVKGEDVLQGGEVLFNNTNSTEWVGKSTVFDSEQQCVCSNHITRLKINPKIANPYFVAALFNTLRSLGLFGLLATNFNNQAGVNNETLLALQIPVPNAKIQEKIVSEIQHRRAKANQLRIEANQIWETAKTNFEKKLIEGDI